MAVAGLIPASASDGGAVTTCGPEQADINGSVTEADLHRYLLLPVLVPEGAERIEVFYSWKDRPLAGPLSSPGGPAGTVLDLGIWDPDGQGTVEGFRGWSGSRQGRSSGSPVFIQAGAADRGYLPGALEPGQWTIELGVGAVAQNGADYTVSVKCVAGSAQDARPAGRVDPTLVLRDGPGWYHGDFHMHGYHSNPKGPDWSTGTVQGPSFIDQALTAGLDFAPVTEYVTTAHWNELGAAQAASPNLLLWPGREIITYSGHATTLGETPNVVEYRHGHEQVTLRKIQEQANTDGALFQVNHPTFFPGPLGPLCRGCEFRLGDGIDWNEVDTLEVLTGPVEVTAKDGGLPDAVPGSMENPFVASAIDLWERMLRRGHRITAVSGSDSKGVEPTAAERKRAGYGSSATAVYAKELSRPALEEALLEGRAYVRTRGVDESPALDLQVTAGRKNVTFGGMLRADTAQMRVVVAGASGQTLRVYRNGTLVSTVPVVGDDFEHRMAIRRDPLNEGPLGTFWRVETADTKVRTTIGNPVFLRPPPPGKVGR